MTAQPLLQFGTVVLDPAPDGRVVRFQAALAEQLFDIAERERVPQVPAHSTKNQRGLGLSPFEDRRSNCLLHDLFRLPAAAGRSCNTTRNCVLCDPRRRNPSVWRGFRPARITTYKDSAPRRKSTPSLPDIGKTHERLTASRPTLQNGVANHRDAATTDVMLAGNWKPSRMGWRTTSPFVA